ncbi:hypothetical protein [Micromonospora sp. NBC_01412]|uniref:hypothetical protein n=1 Tax=Micromonospora sp. NBC_01412 TaxID=2903590 RepID=UPI0032535AF5
MVNPSGAHRTPAETWVPVERRWLGLDRRSLAPALVVAAIAVVLVVILPAIGRAVPSDDPIRAGDRLDLGGGITVTPPVGWQLTSGVRVGANTTVPTSPGSANAQVTRNGVTATIHVAKFAGDPGALLDQVERIDAVSPARPKFAVAAGRVTVTAQGGLVGLAESYASASSEGVVAAYQFPVSGTGMTIVVGAPTGQYAANTAEITAMLRSVTPEEPS